MQRNRMIAIAPIVLGCLCLAGYAADLKLNSSDLEQGRLYLQQTRNYVIGATKGLSDAQWKFKPAPDRWSIAEMVEHMVLAQDLALGPVREQLAQAPAAAEVNAKQVDTLVLDRMPDRLVKFQAPDILKPTGRWTHAQAFERLLKNYAALNDYLESTPDLREHAIAAPPIEAVSKGTVHTMDGYQWLLAIAGHVERHTKQILEVKADPNFPAK
jgi:hypothetical protein